MQQSLATKTVLITGASSGIGEATARLLSEQGHRIVMGARRTDRLQSLADNLNWNGGQVVYQQVDVTKLTDLHKLVELAIQTYGGVDVIVNNAGIMPLSHLNALKIDEWNQES